MIAECGAFYCSLGVVADIGQTLNSSITYQHLVANNPDVSPMSGSSDCSLGTFCVSPVSLCCLPHRCVL